jgi:hypothetical protein
MIYLSVSKKIILFCCKIKKSSIIYKRSTKQHLTILNKNTDLKSYFYFIKMV